MLTKKLPCKLPKLPCRVYWGSHGCCLPKGHDGEHLCTCSLDEEGNLIPHDYENNVGRSPYYGGVTRFYGQDVKPGRLMAAAMNEGDFKPSEALVVPQPFHHPDGSVTYQSPEETRKLREYWAAKERLIAASPDLLRIVEMLKQWKDLGAEQIYFGTLMPSEDADSTEDLEDAVNSALAKVRGGSL